MITLTFNSTSRTVKITDEKKDILHTFNEVPTVQVRDGFYEVMQSASFSDKETKIPVCRLPIALTLMLIER
jgi:hypothetical protein